MASISKRDNGSWELQFVDKRGKRRTLRIGEMDRRSAHGIKRHVEKLVAVSISGEALDNQTSEWVAECGDKLRSKLKKYGLVKHGTSRYLREHLDQYIRTTSAKPATKTVWRRCQRLLIAYFGANRPLDTIGLGDAKDWRAWMLREGHKPKKGPATGLAENTVRKMCSIASQFFRDAIDRELIIRNPFTNRDIPRTTREDRSRDFFVTRETAAAVLEACPDAEWRLIFALSRYGGLRCPSEHLSLRWADIDWEKGKMRVTSPKTEHHAGKESRLVPIFPELLPFLEAVWDAAKPGSEFVITRYRDLNINLRTQLERILAIAGVDPWPKLFHNLRATRETELAAEHPIHVVCAWIGNSPTIAARHYLTVTESDFEKARHKARQSSSETVEQEWTQETSEVEFHRRKDREKSSMSDCVRESHKGREWSRQDSNL